MDKNIVIAIHSLSGGGAERVACEWANQLFENGFKISIITFHREDEEYFIDEHINVFSVAKNYDEFLKLNFFKKCAIIRSFIKRVNANYVVSFLPTMQMYMYLATRGMRVALINTLRNNPWIEYSEQGFIKKYFWKKSYKKSYKIVLQTQGQKEFFSTKIKNKCFIIPNPISDKYVFDYKNRIYSDQVTNFIAVGRINEQKNYPLMIRAFSKVCLNHPDIKLQIFGAGSIQLSNSLNDLISELSMRNNIKLMGRTQKISEEYKKNDVFLMTSNYEGMPNALMEAMANELICISTDCKTGPKDLITNNKIGFLVPIGDEEQLVESIESVLKLSKSERMELTQNARKQILNFCSRQNSVEKLLEIFN